MLAVLADALRPQEHARRGLVEGQRGGAVGRVDPQRHGHGLPAGDEDGAVLRDPRVDRQPERAGPGRDDPVGHVGEVLHLDREAVVWAQRWIVRYLDEGPGEHRLWRIVTEAGGAPRDRCAVWKPDELSARLGDARDHQPQALAGTQREPVGVSADDVPVDGRGQPRLALLGWGGADLVDRVGDLLAWLERPPTKLVAVAKPEVLAAVRVDLEQRFDGRVFVNNVFFAARIESYTLDRESHLLATFCSGHNQFLLDSVRRPVRGRRGGRRTSGSVDDFR